MNNYIEDLQWRYATKIFDATRKISDDNLEILKNAMQLSASSYGLQPYEILIIKNSEIRKKLKAASWNQPQITDASCLIVLANSVNFNEGSINDYILNIAGTRSISTSVLDGLKQTMSQTLLTKSSEDLNNWTSKQAYIVLGNLLSAAANLHIDACPMEGFDASQYNDILGLSEKGLNAAVIVAIGYRAEDDTTQHLQKVRKPKTQLFHSI